MADLKKEIGKLAAKLAKYEGEKSFAAMRFLSEEEIPGEAELLSDAPAMTAMGTDAVREDEGSELERIPFAFDDDSCYLAVDLTPAKKGKKGQIISIDMENEESYLLAADIDEFLKKLKGWQKEGFFTEEDHFFNKLDEITASEAGDAEEIEMPDDFWREYASKKLKYPSDKLPVDVLAAEKKLMIRDKTLSCKPFGRMTALKEIIFHNCVLKDVSVLGEIPELTSLIFVNTVFSDGDVAVLAASPKLKSLNFNVMSVRGIDALKGKKTIKSLHLREVTDFRGTYLAGLTGLQELELEDVENWTTADLTELKTLTKLTLSCKKLSDVSFLGIMTKLKEFECHVKADDESGLSALAGLLKLASFIYPVSDISVYKDCKALTSIGLTPDVKSGFEIFEGSQVRSFTVIGKISDSKLDKMNDNLSKYVQIFSYGSIG